MKKIISTLLCLFLSQAAVAGSQIDTMFQKAGIIDEDYLYTDIDIVRQAFKLASNEYAQSLPMQMNEVIEVYAVSFLPSTAVYEYRLTVPLTQSERQDFVQIMSSPETLQQSCEEFFLVNQYMVKNDVTLIYSYNDVDYRPLAKLIMRNDNCL